MTHRNKVILVINDGKQFWYKIPSHVDIPEELLKHKDQVIFGNRDFIEERTLFEKYFGIGLLNDYDDSELSDDKIEIKNELDSDANFSDYYVDDMITICLDNQVIVFIFDSDT